MPTASAAAGYAEVLSPTRRNSARTPPTAASAEANTMPVTPLVTTENPTAEALPGPHPKKRPSNRHGKPFGLRLDHDCGLDVIPAVPSRFIANRASDPHRNSSGDPRASRNLPLASATCLIPRSSRQSMAQYPTSPSPTPPAGSTPAFAVELTSADYDPEKHRTIAILRIRRYRASGTAVAITVVTPPPASERSLALTDYARGYPGMPSAGGYSTTALPPRSPKPARS